MQAYAFRLCAYCANAEICVTHTHTLCAHLSAAFLNSSLGDLPSAHQLASVLNKETSKTFWEVGPEDWS